MWTQWEGNKGGKQVKGMCWRLGRVEGCFSEKKLQVVSAGSLTQPLFKEIFIGTDLEEALDALIFCKEGCFAAKSLRRDCEEDIVTSRI